MRVNGLPPGIGIVSASKAPIPGNFAGEADFPPAGQAWTIVAILMAINVTALLDRFLPALLMGPIERDLHLTDTSVSIIQGYAFAIFYCLAGLPLARMIDRGNRRNLIIVAVLFWSVMTFCCGMAQDYLELFIARAGVGISEAVLAPCAYSIIADTFQRDRRGRAIGLFYGSQSIGVSASFMLGGLLYSRLAHSGGLHLPFFGVLAPWRATFALAAIPGLAAGILAFGFAEPARRESDFATNSERLLPFLRSNIRCLLPLYAMFGVIAFVTLIGPSWATTFFRRIHGVSLAESGTVVGLILLVSGVAGAFFGGILGDHWAAAEPGGRFRLPLFGLLIGTPLLVLWPFMPTIGLSYFAFGLSVFVSSVCLSSAPAIIQEISPNALRARALAVNQIVQFLTTGFSPTAVALVTDHVFHNPMSLAYSISTVDLAGCLAAFTICLVVLKPYRKATIASRNALAGLREQAVLPS